MKTAIFAAVMMVMGSMAFADGFVCDDASGNLRIQVYHQTQPTLGTRNAAVMIVSNPSAASGSKTLAKFTSDSALLTNSSSTYTAKVDLRFSNSNNKNADVAGTKLGELSNIILHVDYSFNNPVHSGTELPGEAILSLRSGADDIRLEMNCERYLKGVE